MPQTPQPLTLRESWQEFADEFLSWDRGLLATWRRLWVAPGAVVRDYTRERRTTHTRPLRYLLLSIAVNIIVLWTIIEHLGWGPRIGIEPDQADLAAFLTEHAAIITLVILPLGAGFMCLLFRGLDVRYVDALIALAYTQGQVNWTQTLLLMPAAVIAEPRLFASLSLGLGVYVVFAWADCGVGPAWRRWGAALLTLISVQAVNAALVFGLARYLA